MNYILDEARRVWLHRFRPSVTNHPDKDRRFRCDDNAPLGFILDGINYEVHFIGNRRATFHGSPLKVPLLLILAINERGDALVFANKVELLPCDG